MRLIKVIKVETREIVPVEYQSSPDSPATAEQHRCRPLSCRLHWRSVVTGTRNVEVLVEFSEDEVAQTLAAKAAHNRSGRAVEYGGLIKARVMKR